MKKKKNGIVLLISLFFITAISILILKNLDDSKEFIDISNNTYNLTQTNISIKNTKEEVLKLFKDKKDDIDILFDNIPSILPLNYADINMQIAISKMATQSLYNLNNPHISDNIDATMTDNIYYTYDFFSLVKDKNITNYRQIDSIIDEYINITKDKKILNIKDKFTFINFSNNDTNSSVDTNSSNSNASLPTYVKCEVSIDINNLKSKYFFIFKVGDENVIYEEFYLQN